VFSSIVSWVAVVLLAATAAGLLISRDWRWSLGFLAGQYLAVFWLVAQHWPIGMAAVKLVTGWMTIAALGITRLGLPVEEELPEQFWPQGRAFRLFAAGMVALLSAAATARLETVMPGLGMPVIAGSLLLIGMGLLHLGITTQTLRVILALLTVLAGFETFYAAVEGSILVAALLAVVNLGLGLVGSYLMNAAAAESSG
jgi:hypothetical protein